MRNYGIATIIYASIIVTVALIPVFGLLWEFIK